MENSMKKEMYEFVAECKKIIKINKGKIDEYYLYKHFFNDTVKK